MGSIRFTDPIICFKGLAMEADGNTHKASFELMSCIHFAAKLSQLVINFQCVLYRWIMFFLFSNPVQCLNVVLHSSFDFVE